MAIENEVNEFIKTHQHLTLSEGLQRVVRNGYQPERTIQTGIGSIALKLPRVRDREKLRRKSNFIPS